ncbi:SPOR domain-containing protein [Cohnella endophytica]|uniref:SPOR domain-containing protein n=1 Tax=Cohnella endophytica TaxID=2419778 RepID=A0A494XUK1_9BACL|nr:SPOR domain-containing protein [Cohnella endophytica]RKP54238.1 SPOR domain-containing protein [Cohnella endophytica]
MQSKARMTFRFEPSKPKENPTNIPHENTISELVTESFPLASLPERSAESSDRPSSKSEGVHGERDYTAWNSPYQDDIHALEEIIRKTGSKGASYEPYLTVVPKEASPVDKRSISAGTPQLPHIDLEEIEPDAGLWSRYIYGKDEQMNRHSEPSEADRYSREHDGRERNPSWGRVFLSVAAAVATGALFGYLVLSLFTGEPMFPGKSEVPASSISNKAKSQANQAIGAESSAAAEATLQAPGTKEKTRPVGAQTEGSTFQLDSNVYYMLQYGVFHTKDSMLTAVKQLEDKGLASAADSSDGYRVYAAAARSKSEAESIAAQLPDTDVYIKAFGGEAIKVASERLSAQGALFMNASADFTRKLVQYSELALRDSSPQKLKDADFAVLRKSEREWRNAIDAADQLQGDARTEGKTVIQALTSAMDHMDAYQSKPSRAGLWSAQTETMKALLADHRLRSILQSPGVG